MKLRFLLIIILLIVAAFILLFHGPAGISFDRVIHAIFNSDGINSNIIWYIRMPKIVTAILAGAALATCGLIMQTYFQNPLAGPFVLGISSGASLGVAIWILASSLLPVVLYRFGMTTFAVAGSLSVLLLLLFCSRKIGGSVILLVLGLVFGYFSSGIINVLIVISNAHKIKSFLLWTLGSFSRVSGNDLIIFSVVIVFFIGISLLFIRPLNALLLGSDYAKSLGIDLKRIRLSLLIITAMLTGIVTSYCGPIAFLGIIVPHIAKILLDSSDHKFLMPATILIGSLVALIAELFSSFVVNISLPINAVMGLLGAPLIILFLWKNRARGEL